MLTVHAAGCGIAHGRFSEMLNSRRRDYPAVAPSTPPSLTGQTTHSRFVRGFVVLRKIPIAEELTVDYRGAEKLVPS
jgi:hypothetical protein